MLQSSFEHINIINFKRCKVMKHEENVDLKLLSKVCKIDSRMKVIQITNKSAIGLKRWARIDYLCNIKGYRIVSSGVSIGDKFDYLDIKSHNREIKKQVKEAKANNNMAKKSNKKRK